MRRAFADGDCQRDDTCGRCSIPVVMLIIYSCTTPSKRTQAEYTASLYLDNKFAVLHIPARDTSRSGRLSRTWNGHDNDAVHEDIAWHRSANCLEGHFTPIITASSAGHWDSIGGSFSSSVAFHMIKCCVTHWQRLPCMRRSENWNPIRPMLSWHSR